MTRLHRTVSLRPLIDAVAGVFALPADLVEAIVRVESSGDPEAYAYEPEFWARYLAQHPTYRLEDPRRVSASYGLMQTMYVVAREVGFVGDPELLKQPAISLMVGCKKLRQLLDDTGSEPAAIASYNGGTGGNRRPPFRNAGYLSKVNRERDLVRRERGR